MDLVSNFVGSISPSMFGNNTQGIKPSIDFDDNTFSNLLEKQMNKEIEQGKQNFVDSLGLPTGINIAELDGSYNERDDKLLAIKPVNEFEKTDFNYVKNPKDLSTSEVLTFFSSLFESKPTLTDTSQSGLFDFERKLAASQYGQYAKNLVTDLSEFVADAFKKS